MSFLIEYIMNDISRLARHIKPIHWVIESFTRMHTNVDLFLLIELHKNACIRSVAGTIEVFFKGNYDIFEQIFSMVSWSNYNQIVISITWLESINDFLF